MLIYFDLLLLFSGDVWIFREAIIHFFPYVPTKNQCRTPENRRRRRRRAEEEREAAAAAGEAAEEAAAAEGEDAEEEARGHRRMARGGIALYGALFTQA